MIKVKNLTKRYGKLTALDHVSFEIKENVVCGILGPNGAGKTTLFHLLMGFIPRTDGSVTIANTKVSLNHPSKDVRFLEDVPTFYDYMTAYEYLQLIADLNHINRKAINEMLKMVKIYDQRHKKIASFSRGMKQRLGIAATVLPNPKVLILDEPISALDPIGRKEIFDLLEELKKYVTILFSTHILTDASRICDHIILLNEGKVLLNETIQTIEKKYLGDVLEIRFLNEEGLINFKKHQVIPNQTSFDMDNQNYVVRFKSPSLIELEQDILKTLVERKITVSSISLKKPTLEEIFLSEVIKK